MAGIVRRVMSARSRRLNVPEEAPEVRRPAKLPYIAGALVIVLGLAVAFGLTHAGGLSPASSAQGPFAGAQTSAAPGNPGVQLNGTGYLAQPFTLR